VITALLYNVKVKYLTRRRVEISLIPNWLGKKLRRSIRVGQAIRASNTEGEMCWWWKATDRHVGDYIERYIEAAPVLSLEDMPVELLLQEGSDDGKNHR
jgi:hypothetical protein